MMESAKMINMNEEVQQLVKTEGETGARRMVNVVTNIDKLVDEIEKRGEKEYKGKKMKKGNGEFKMIVKELVVEQMKDREKFEKDVKYFETKQLFTFCAFWLPGIGKTLVHVSKSRGGDFRDAFSKTFSFFGKSRLRKRDVAKRVRGFC